MHITELTLRSADVSRQRIFYHYTLGFSLLEDSRHRVTVKVGETHLCFEQSPSYSTGVYHFAFNIPENQFAEAKDWLAARVTLLDDGAADEFFSPNWNAHYCYFRDADGNIVELIARHTLDNASQEPFDQHGILRVSEIGLPCPHVMEMLPDLKAQFQLTVYRGTPNPTFTAVGDEHGLLILVEEGRLWQPTDDEPATILPTEITIAGDEKTYEFPDLPYLLRATQNDV